MTRMAKWRLTLMAAAIIAGLIMPPVAAHVQDMLSTNAWSLSGDEAHYVYSGTLRNRALALNSYRNGAHMVTAHTFTMNAQDAPECWSALWSAGLVPPRPQSCSLSAEALSLAPTNYAARYDYACVRQSGGDSRLNATVDVSDGRCLVVELKCDADELSAWRGEASLMELLSRFAAYWGFDGVKEGLSSHAPGGLCSQSASVMGTYYEVSVLTMPERGFLMYRLSAC